jgi:hypothetical protein
MGRIVQFDPETNFVTKYLATVDESTFVGQANTLINPSLDEVAGIDPKYWKVSNGSVVSDSAEEISSVDAADAALQLSAIREGAKDYFDGLSDLPLALRAFADISVSEINSLREWIVAFKAAVAASTSLANLQSRIAALPDMPDRTLSQLKTAIKNDIDSGSLGNN